MTDPTTPTIEVMKPCPQCQPGADDDNDWQLLHLDFEKYLLHKYVPNAGAIEGHEGAEVIKLTEEQRVMPVGWTHIPTREGTDTIEHSYVERRLAGGR